jgi:Flp pilus assembly protein TadG
MPETEPAGAKAAAARSIIAYEVNPLEASGSGTADLPRSRYRQGIPYSPNQLGDVTMLRRSSNKVGRPRRAAAAVEFALILPLLCFIFIAVVDFGRVFYYSIAVNNCARNGALYGSADQAHALDTAGIKTAAQIDGFNMSLSQLNVTSQTDSTTSPTYVEVTVTYPFTTITQYPGIVSPLTLSRTVRMSVVPATPVFN